MSSCAIAVDGNYLLIAVLANRHTSVNCLAGTGDFRIFVGDTAGAKQVTADGFVAATAEPVA